MLIFKLDEINKLEYKKYSYTFVEDYFILQDHENTYIFDNGYGTIKIHIGRDKINNLFLIDTIDLEIAKDTLNATRHENLKEIFENSGFIENKEEEDSENQGDVEPTIENIEYNDFENMVKMLIILDQNFKGENMDFSIECSSGRNPAQADYEYGFEPTPETKKIMDKLIEKANPVGWTYEYNDNGGTDKYPGRIYFEISENDYSNHQKIEMQNELDKLINKYEIG